MGENRVEVAVPESLSGHTAVLARISERVAEMRKSERRVAGVILDDPAAALAMSMARLAEAADVSDPTVMRFCSAVGYDGYQTFRLALAQSLAFGVPATNSAIVKGDTSEMIIDKIFAYTCLDHTRRTLAVEPVVEAISLIAAARELVFLGHGASHIIAMDAAQKFPLFGVPCSAPGDTHEQHMMASMATAGVVVTLISNTGHTSSILDLAELSRDNGATVIGIAGQPSPLTEIVDVALIVETLENTDLFTPTISRIAALVLIDVLSTGVALLRPDSQVERMQEMKASLADMRTGRL